MAETMGRVSASFHPKFIISAGGNFLPAGLPGAARRGALGFSRGEKRAAVGLARFPSRSRRPGSAQAPGLTTPTT